MMDNQEEAKLDQGSVLAGQAERREPRVAGSGDQTRPDLEAQPEHQRESPEKTTSDTEPSDQPAEATGPRLDLTKIRDLILLAHEDVVPELVAGETFEELLASVGPARGAFQQVVERIVRTGTIPAAGSGAATHATQMKASPIPAGQPGRAATHDSQAVNLNPSAKIAEGLRRRVG